MNRLKSGKLMIAGLFIMNYNSNNHFLKYSYRHALRVTRAQICIIFAHHSRKHRVFQPFNRLYSNMDSTINVIITYSLSRWLINAKNENITLAMGVAIKTSRPN